MLHQHHAGHQHHKAPMEKRQDAGTVVQYVYKTAAKTFDGPVAGYMTVAAQPANTPSADSSPNSNSNGNSNSNSNSNAQQQAQDQAAQQVAQQSAEAAASSAAVSQAIAKAKATQQPAQPTVAAATSTEQKAQPSSTPEKTKGAVEATSSSSSTTVTELTKSSVAAATSSKAVASSPTSSFIESTSSSSSSTPTHTAAPSTGSSGGLSGGGKAGLAIGILLLLGLLFAGLFFCYRRRKNREAEAYGKADDEKSAYAAELNRSNTMTSTRTTATAPRLSLRPVTQFLPDLASKGKATNAAGVAGGAAMASRNQNDPANPFGNHAALQPSQRSSDEEKNMLPIQGTPENPFADNAAAPASNGPTAPGSMLPSADAPAPLRIKTPTPEAAAAAGAGAGLLGAGAVAAAKHNERNNAPKPLALSPNRPVSPTGASPAVSEFSQTPVSPGAMANGPPPSNVHRIQLDFKPSMDDEISFRAGQLVRLLHEYDDGWVSTCCPFSTSLSTNLQSQALCIRLDRSQQGVAPRTCLSARPVKPRPPPGARAGPGPRGPPPGMMGPGQQRPQSPAGGRGSPSPYARQPRPISPGPNRGSQQRSMSPGPYGGGPQRPAVIPAPGSKRRSNSASDVQARRMTPPGPSPMNPNVQRVPMQQQAVMSPDSASIASPSPPVSMMPPTRKPVPGQAL